MPENLGDAFWEILWNWHLAGRALPQDLTAEVSPNGPQIWLRTPMQTYRCRRSGSAVQGPLWVVDPPLQEPRRILL